MAEDFMDKVFSLFSGDGLTDEKQSMLKAVGKDLNQNKHAKFFKLRTEETDPSFTSFLFSVFKTIHPLKMFMKDEKKMYLLRAMTVDSCISGSIKETISRLEVSALDVKARTMSGEQLIESIQADIDLLNNQFDSKAVLTVNHRYEQASALNQFVMYNFVGFFKKFDPHFTEGSVKIEPKFPPIKTILIIDQISDFLTVSQPIVRDEDWNGLIGLINKIEGHDLVTTEDFNSMINMLREIHASKILELMVQFTLRNPVWHWKHSVFRETIAESWLESKKTEGYGYIAKINLARKNSQISALTKQIFETAELVRLDNYTVHNSETYRKKNVEYFLFAEGLNYLKAFIEDYLVKEIKELCDIIIIRGQWTNNSMSREMSESLHKLLEIPVRIDDLDIVMGEDGSDGSRLRAAVARVDRDSTQIRYINSIVIKNNNEALDIINESANEFIVIGKHLKNLIEDIQKKHPELLINWREVNLVSKEPIKERMINNFKRINYFVQLLHLCTQTF